MDKATYSVFVDWDNGPGQSPPVAPFIGSDDDISAYVLSMDWTNGNDSGESGNIRAGSCTIKLDNSTSIFSSYNAASILYGRILPGLRVKIVMTIGAGAPVVMWQGFLDSIVPTVGAVIGISTATLQADGILAQFPADSDTDIAMQTDIKTGDAIDLILDAANVPAIDRAIQTGQSTLSRFWARKGRTLDLLRELETAETGLIRETKDGKISFEDRSLRLGLYVRSTYGTGVLNLWDPQQDNSLLNIYNSIQARVRTFNVSDSVTLATVIDVANALGGAAIPIANAEVKIIDIDFPTPSSPAEYLAVSSWGIVDLNINTAADGSGTDLTNTGITLARQELGRKLRITITNGSGSAGYLILLRAHGVAVVEGDPLTVMAEDLTSQGKYRKRAYPNPSQWLTQLSEGQAYCNHIIALSKDPRPALRYTLKANYDATHLAEAQVIDISDKIHVTASLATFGLALNTDFFVEWMHHSVDASRLHTVQVYCRAVSTHSWAASGTSYTPKIVPSSDRKVPDDLECYSIANGLTCYVGSIAWKWNAGIDLAEFRARCYAETAVGFHTNFAEWATSGNYTIPTTGSLAIWINRADEFQDYERIILQSINGTDQFKIFTDGIGHLCAGWAKSGNNHQVVTDIGLLPLNQWTLLILTWANGGDTNLYLSGNLAGTTASLDATWNTGVTTLETHFYGAEAFLTIWDSVLSAGDIASLAASATPDQVNVANLKDSWRMPGPGTGQAYYSEISSGPNAAEGLTNNYCVKESGPPHVGSSSPGDSADLRTPAEGGNLVDNGITEIIRTGLTADHNGLAQTLISTVRSRWYFAFRFRNASGWSVWSDGNDTPQYVKDYVDTSDISTTDSGPPSDWSVWIRAGEQPGTAIVSATRPAVNGNVIWFAAFQVKDATVGSWYDVDADTGASDTKYDGSAIPHAVELNGKKIRRITGTGFGTAAIGDLIIMDMRGAGNFAIEHVKWAVVTNFDGKRPGDPGYDPSTATFLMITEGQLTPADPTDVRIEIVSAPWGWNSDGYLGGSPGHGYQQKEYWQLHGDTTSAIFESDPIVLPPGTNLADLGGRVWFENAYSRNDDDTHSDPLPEAPTSSYHVPLAFANPLVVNCALVRGTGGVFVVTLTGDTELQLINGVCMQAIAIHFIQDGTGGRVITLGSMVNQSGSVAFTPSIAVNARDYAGFFCSEEKVSSPPTTVYDLVSFVPGF